MSRLRSEVKSMTAAQFVDFECKVKTALERPSRFRAAAWGYDGHGLL